ncbi:MAG TPA: homoserine dehydrogenase [Candidatus Limnocylindrales bacterium]|nr:homoserine dehydrogenase [Candidatus Limnocylindrales bacterium]
MSHAPLRVAVLGAGTVGREVVRGLVGRSEFELVGVAVRDLDRARRAGLPGDLPADLLTDAPAHLVAAPDTDVIVELMGGDEPSHTLIAAALGAGKAVVTANKHVVAHHGASLEAIARRTGASLRFEAAVGGGIPVLGPLAADLAANRITRVRGIVNGTTNHILSAMATDGQSYEAALRDAQAHGYAEADPAGDVEGHDAVNKLVILARLAFGGWAEPGWVVGRPPTVRGADAGGLGITGVTADEVTGAAAVGCSLRLIARAELGSSRGRGRGSEGGRSIALSVVPSAVPSASPLGATSGVRNRIEVDGEPVGSVGFDGPGAGGAATSSAVIGDLLAIARGGGSTWAGLPAARSVDRSDVRGGFDGPRSWFLVVPGARSGAASAGAGRPIGGGLAEQSAEVGGGLAVRTRPMTLEALRRKVGPLLADGADATCYPVDA